MLLQNFSNYFRSKIGVTLQQRFFDEPEIRRLRIWNTFIYYTLAQDTNMSFYSKSLIWVLYSLLFYHYSYYTKFYYIYRYYCHGDGWEIFHRLWRVRIKIIVKIEFFELVDDHGTDVKILRAVFRVKVIMRILEFRLSHDHYLLNHNISEIWGISVLKSLLLPVFDF